MVNKFFGIMIQSPDYSIDFSKSNTISQVLFKLKSYEWDKKINEFLEREKNGIDSCPPTFAIQDSGGSQKHTPFIQVSFMNLKEVHVTYSIPRIKKILGIVPYQSEEKMEFHPKPREIAFTVLKWFVEGDRENIKSI